jgi:hypothetical protein
VTVECNSSVGRGDVPCGWAELGGGGYDCGCVTSKRPQRNYFFSQGSPQRRDKQNDTCLTELLCSTSQDRWIVEIDSCPGEEGHAPVGNPSFNAGQHAPRSRGDANQIRRPIVLPQFGAVRTVTHVEISLQGLVTVGILENDISGKDIGQSRDVGKGR